MKVFVINLERSTARRAFMRRQLASRDLDFEFVKAVDGAALSDDEVARVCDFAQLARRPHLRRRGVYGCLLSHYSVYERIVAENLPCALVLEDDVVVDAALGALLSALAPQLQAGEVLLLYSQNTYMPTVLSEQHAQPLPGGYQLSYPLEPWACGSTSGYLISQQAAQALLSLLLPIHCASDAWGLFYDEKAIGSLRCVTPFPVKPAGFKSEIDYVAPASLLGKVLTFIDERRLFPLKQLLDYRRRRGHAQAMRYSFSAEPSRIPAPPGPRPST